MDRIEKITQEAKGELARLQVKHKKEWDEILEESKAALSRAETRKELKTISKRNKERMEELRKRQQEELVNVQRNYVKALESQ